MLVSHGIGEIITCRFHFTQQGSISFSYDGPEPVRTATTATTRPGLNFARIASVRPDSSVHSSILPSSHDRNFDATGRDRAALVMPLGCLTLHRVRNLRLFPATERRPNQQASAHCKRPKQNLKRTSPPISERAELYQSQLAKLFA